MSGASSTRGQPRARPWSDDEHAHLGAILDRNQNGRADHARLDRRVDRDRAYRRGRLDAALAVASGTGRPMTADCDLCRRPDRLFIDAEDGTTTARCFRCAHRRWLRETSS